MGIPRPKPFERLLWPGVMNWHRNKEKSMDRLRAGMLMREVNRNQPGGQMS